MKELLEIAQLLSKKKLSKIEAFDLHSIKQPHNKFLAFFDGLQKREFQSDEEAARFLYKATPADDRYRQLKSRFKRRLLNTFFFLDVNQPKTGDLQTARNYCYRQLSLIHLLRAHGAVQSAAGEALQVQQIALKYLFADVVISTAAILRDISADAGDEKNFHTQQGLILQHQPLREAELHGEGLLQTIRLAYWSNEVGARNLLPGIHAYCDELLHYTELFQAPVISLNAFEAWMLRFELDGDFAAAGEVGLQAEQYLKKHPHWQSREKALFFALGRLRAAMHLKDFNKGRAVAESAFRLLTPNSQERHELMELYLLLSIHSDSILHAFAIYKDAMEHKSANQTKDEQKQKWEIFDAYVHLLMELRPVSQQFVLSQKKKRFKVETFLDTPIPFLPQKENQTILVAVAQIVFLLHNKNLNAASRQIEWLFNLSRTLKRKEILKRQTIFIHLLHQLQVSEFRPSVMKKQDALVQELKATPLRYRGQLHNLEVIPYEKLWEMVLGFFK